jgi:hypothetical protein
MHLNQLRRIVVAAFVAACFAAVPVHAAKRRSVRSPSSGDSLTATLTGVVTDAPVIYARVSVGNRFDSTDESGKYELRNVTVFATTMPVVAERTGYVAKTTTLTTGGAQTVNFVLTPTPTVQVRKVDGTTFSVDQESILFGYPVVFSGYREDESEDFCKPDGTQIVVHRSEIKQITGPAVPATSAACCPGVQTVRVNVELKTGEKTDMYFVDACNGFPNIDFKGRNHVTGKTEYTPFNQISSIVFP